MRNILRHGGRLAMLLLALICCYTLILLAAYSFPDSYIEPKVNAAVEILESEGNMLGGYANYFSFGAISITDNLTDKEMFKGLLRNGRGVVDSAMRTDYGRYWHGYAALLRPLSVVLSVIHIRYINIMLIIGLLLLCYYRCRVELGARTALCFAVGLLMSFLLLAPFCQQYLTVTLLTLLGCYVVLSRWRQLSHNMYEAFLVLGSLVCFFDFLTFPVLALGYPLVCSLLLMIKQKESASTLWKRTILLSAAWMAGYALTWINKVLIGSLLTGQDMLSDFLTNAAFRTAGDLVYATRVEKITAFDAIGINIQTFFNGSNIACFALLVVWAVTRALTRRAPAEEWLRALPVAFVALYPLIWYCVLQNHSRMHFWMTYKQLSVLVFALTAALLSIDGRREKAAVNPQPLE